jgi:hypothetical protein
LYSRLTSRFQVGTLGRRGCATILNELTGNANASYQVPGNSIPANYIKPSI